MTTQHVQLVECALDALLHPKRLYCAAEILVRPNPVPKSPGVYAWYFDELPLLLTKTGRGKFEVPAPWYL
jgi:hypothetical protein